MAVQFVVNGNVTLQANAVQGEPFVVICRVRDLDVNDGDTFMIDVPNGINFDDGDTFEIPDGSFGNGDFDITFESTDGFTTAGQHVIRILKQSSAGGVATNEGTLTVNVSATVPNQQNRNTTQTPLVPHVDPANTVIPNLPNVPAGTFYFAPVITVHAPTSAVPPTPTLAPPATVPPPVVPPVPLRQPGRFEGAGLIFWPLCIFLLGLMLFLVFVLWPTDSAVSQGRDTEAAIQRNAAAASAAAARAAASAPASQPGMVNIYIGQNPVAFASSSPVRMCRHNLPNPPAGSGITYYNAPCP